MQFTNFSRTEDGLTITLYTQYPIANVGEIKFFKDNAIGTFTKKEYRWSFTNEYWSGWEKLTQNGITAINTYSNYYLFLQIRYTLSALNSGTVTAFTLNYLEGTATLGSGILTEDIQHRDASTILIHDILQTHRIIPITDASLLNGHPGSFYLDRRNQFGIQPISSITNLQAILDTKATYAYINENFVLKSGLSFDGISGGANWSAQSDIINGGENWTNDPSVQPIDGGIW